MLNLADLWDIHEQKILKGIFWKNILLAKWV